MRSTGASLILLLLFSPKNFLPKAVIEKMSGKRIVRTDKQMILNNQPTKPNQTQRSSHHIRYFYRNKSFTRILEYVTENQLDFFFLNV